MITFRPLHAVRMLALASLLVCAPAVVLAQASAPAAKAPVAKKHVNRAAAAEQSEMNEHLAKMAEQLKLTDDQVAKVREIMQSKMTEMKTMKAKYKGMPATPENKAAMEKDRQAMHADIETKLATVLSPEQMTEYKKMSAEHMKKESAEKAEEAKK